MLPRRSDWHLSSAVLASHHYRLRRRLLHFGFVALTFALSIARCWRWIADTAALVHRPAIVLAQVNMMLRGVAFMYPRGELHVSERPAASLAPHQPCSSASAHHIDRGASACTAATLDLADCASALPGILRVECGAGVTLHDQAQTIATEARKACSRASAFA